MMDDMAWMIVTVDHDCNWSRPKSIYSFNAKPSPEPQQRPRDFVDYCVTMGWAEEVSSPNKADAPADAGVVKRAQQPGRKRA